MIGDVQHGLGYPQWSSVSPAAGDFHNPDVRRYLYDLEGANEVLDGLGWLDSDGDGIREDDLGHPISFTLITNGGNSVRAEITQIVLEGMMALGLDVELRLVGFGDLVAQLKTRAEFYRQAQAIAAENVPLIYTTLGERLGAVRNVLGNYMPTLYG